MKAAKAKSPRKAARPAKDETEIIELVPAVLKVKRVLVPFDFSPLCRKALRYALGFAEQFGAEVVLVHVVEPQISPVDYLVVPPEMEDVNIRLREAATEKLAGIVTRMKKKTRVGAKALVRIGKPFQEIADVAAAEDVDLVILATHGYTGLKHAYLGSVAERVVQYAPCPVLVVRERGHRLV
ncbi:MAG: universal stress protein [Verrucomicrobiota bacterium]